MEATTERHFTDQGIVYYGPHACEECGETIVKAAREFGGTEFDYPAGGMVYPNHVWRRHEHGRRSSTTLTSATDADVSAGIDPLAPVLDLGSTDAATPTPDTVSGPDGFSEGFSGGSSGGGGADGDY